MTKRNPRRGRRSNAPPLKVGDRVLIAGPPGKVTGEVLGVATPDQAPDIEGAPPAAVIKDILREFQVDLLLLIAHKHEDREVCFFALRHPGGWRDLSGQQIQIMKLHGAD